MKTAVTLVLLICFLHDSCTGPVAPSVVIGSVCCRGHAQTRIPPARVRHVGMAGDCGSRAIVITTVCELIHCINPDWDWAKNLLKKFNESSGPPFNTKSCTRNN